jgi:O-6-methylguanine DNA methyltransferase
LYRAGLQLPLSSKLTLEDFHLFLGNDLHQAVHGQDQEPWVGEARSYTWIARRIGRPRAMRAVGSALARNPVPFIVPCHRVLRTDGGLGGYALGLPLKRRLLEFERGTPVLEGCATTGIVCRVGCAALRRARPDTRVVFATLADARSVGYRSCEACRPRGASNVAAAMSRTGS